MTFSFIKPDSGPSPLIDVVQIQTNFATFATAFAINHTAMNLAKQGNHEAVVINNRVGDPGVVGDEAILFSKDAVAKSATEPQLFAQIPQFLPTATDTTDAPNIGMQLTNSTVNIIGPVYQSFLVGGYLIYFGTVTDITVDVILVPAPTQLLVANVTPYTFKTGFFTIQFDASTVINTTLNDRFKINSTLNGTGPVIPYIFGWVALAKA